MIDEKWDNATKEDVLLVLVSQICRSEAEERFGWLQAFLEQNEPDFDATDASGLTALHIAAASESSATLNLLLSSGARSTLSSTEFSAELPLHTAARFGRDDNIEILLTWEDNVDAIDELGNTSLHVAAKHDQLCTIQLLLKRGARIDSINSEDKTALLLATARLTSSCPHQASCSTACVDVLLKNMASTDMQDCDGWTALHHASASQSPLAPLLVEILLVHNAKVDVSDKLHRTALQYASEVGLHTTMEVLLESGAAVNWQDGRDLTALHYACKSVSPDQKVPIVIKHLTDLDVESAEGWTALHYACARDKYSIVEILLRAGADAAIENHEFKKPRDLTGDEAVLKLIDNFRSHWV